LEKEATSVDFVNQRLTNLIDSNRE